MRDPKDMSYNDFSVLSVADQPQSENNYNYIDMPNRSVSPEPMRLVDFGSDAGTNEGDRNSANFSKSKSNQKQIKRALSRMSHESKFRLNVASILNQDDA